MVAQGSAGEIAHGKQDARSCIAIVSVEATSIVLVDTDGGAMEPADVVRHAVLEPLRQQLGEVRSSLSRIGDRELS